METSKNYHFDEHHYLLFLTVQMYALQQYIMRASKWET
jgi:hypothetical protein